MAAYRARATPMKDRKRQRKREYLLSSIYYSSSSHPASSSSSGVVVFLLRRFLLVSVICLHQRPSRGLSYIPPPGSIATRKRCDQQKQRERSCGCRCCSTGVCTPPRRHDGRKGTCHETQQQHMLYREERQRVLICCTARRGYYWQGSGVRTYSSVYKGLYSPRERERPRARESERARPYRVFISICI